MNTAYVATCKCGGMVMAAFCISDNEDVTARTIMEYLDSGFKVEKMAIDDAMQMNLCKNSGKC